MYNFLAQTEYCKQIGQTTAKPLFGPVLISTTSHPESIPQITIRNLKIIK